MTQNQRSDRTGRQIAGRQLPSWLAQSGFTLVEILVVISIIGVLAALLLANFVGVRERAADARKKNDLQQLKKALRLYYNDFQVYPGATSGQGIAGCGVDGDSACGGDFSTNSGEYMKALPADFSYYSDGLDQFLLVVPLDNRSDQDILASQTRCAPASKSFYGLAVGDQDYFVCED